jgi:hypothetical protein
MLSNRSYSRRMLYHQNTALKTTIKHKEHERRKKEERRNEEEREEKRLVLFVQNLEARQVASSVSRDFYARRF